MRFILRCLVAALFFMALLAGCRQEEEIPAETSPTTRTPAAIPPSKHVNRVVVPPEVEAKWKAVKIAVLDKQFNTEEEFTIEIGSEYHLEDAGLTLKVESFLPAFIMEGRIMTSVSNEPKNPAARISVYEKDKVIFSGWLFSFFPNMGSFNHPRYSFCLVDFVPADKKS